MCFRAAPHAACTTARWQFYLEFLNYPTSPNHTRPVEESRDPQSKAAWSRKCAGENAFCTNRLRVAHTCNRLARNSFAQPTVNFMTPKPLHMRGVKENHSEAGL